MWIFFVFFVTRYILEGRCQFLRCHDDPSLDPEDGPLDEMQYTWLGTLQYIHVKNGTPHYFRMPRVTLISRQFVLSTAVDAAQIPDGYALGNVAFGEYERDEEECGVSINQLAAGAECDPAALLIPLSDVLLHPEYKHFGAEDSIAILKLLTPVRSQYMIPVCLPFMNYLRTKNGRTMKDKLYHIDFTNDVPRDFTDEEKEVTFVRLLPRELCYIYDVNENRTHVTKNRVMCTTGCGFHSGAPTVFHEHTGHWSLVAIAQGGSPCPDPLRTRRPPAPPRHIVLHPYVPWITTAISGTAVGAFAKDDPFGFVMPRQGANEVNMHDKLGHDWHGHWWMGGIDCFNRGESAYFMFKFYHEIFSVKPVGVTWMNYYLELYGAHGTTVICVKVGMPYHIGQPRVWDLNTPEVKVRIPVLRFENHYKFQVEAWAMNTTTDDEMTVTSTEETDESKQESES